MRYEKLSPYLLFYVVPFHERLIGCTAHLAVSSRVYFSEFDEEWWSLEMRKESIILEHTVGPPSRSRRRLVHLRLPDVDLVGLVAKFCPFTLLSPPRSPSGRVRRAPNGVGIEDVHGGDGMEVRTVCILHVSFRHIAYNVRWPHTAESVWRAHGDDRGQPSESVANQPVSGANARIRASGFGGGLFQRRKLNVFTFYRASTV